MNEFVTRLFKEIYINDHDIDGIRNLLLEKFIADNSDKGYSNPLAQEHEKYFVTWLNRLRLDNSDLNRLIMEEKSVLVPNISPDISQKISLLSQYHCPICDSSTGGSMIINIRISPISKQSAGKQKRNAFEKAIKERLKNTNTNFDANDRLCVHTVFVMGNSCREKDVDNMSKAFMDALERAGLFNNDKFIDHSSLLKIRWDGPDDYICVNLRKTEINLHQDVLVKSMNSEWGGAKFIELSDYEEADA